MALRSAIGTRSGRIILTILIALVFVGACSKLDDGGLVDPVDGTAGPGGDSGDDWLVYRDIDGDGMIHHVPECTVCHHVFEDSDNLRFIPEILSTPSSGDRAVIFTARQGQNSFADGDNVYDGVCEVCHTATSHHRNDASGDHSHYAGADCIGCHTHAGEFSPTGGGGTGQGHTTHTNGSVGITLACDYCHLSDLSSFQDGHPFATTTVCNECHSPDGLIDGVDDADIGARTNWPAGVYEEGNLGTGKERWCSGCHDLGTSTINGIAAPAVAGDGAWGFYATGHGQGGAVNCLDCHDATATHFDGIADSYRVIDDNYQTAFRLADLDGQPPLNIPRNGFEWDGPYTDPDYYALCFSCHDKYALLGSPDAPAGPYNMPAITTNFRSDPSVIIPDGESTDIAGYSISGAISKNSHYTHLAGPPQFYDSDRDGAVDSYGTCVACHNVHGSTSPAMVRDGKLIDHEPGLNYDWVRYDRHGPLIGGCADPIYMTSTAVTGPESHGGVMRSNGGPAGNGICNYCHCSGAATGDPEYVINCYGPDCVDYYRVYIEPGPIGP